MALTKSSLKDQVVFALLVVESLGFGIWVTVHNAIYTGVHEPHRTHAKVPLVN